MSDAEHERMDNLLREAMAAPPPSLSSKFERGLSRRLRPHRLSFASRFVLVVYALMALAVSVWALRPLPAYGLPIISFVLIPASFVWAIRRFRLFNW